jgi:SAM-dependent methyltransferase
MNEGHLQFLASPEWGQMLEAELLPWIVQAGDLGEDVVEVGPGPGLTTELLRTRVTRLTAIELDPALAGKLARRLEGTNVTVICADATNSGLESSHYSATTCFSMLHHLPSAEHQDRLFVELNRLLRHGGLLIGVDGIDSEAVRDFHVDDTYVPVDPATIDVRLADAGFTDVVVEPADYQFFFKATKP